MLSILHVKMENYKKDQVSSYRTSLLQFSVHSYPSVAFWLVVCGFVARKSPVALSAPFILLPFRACTHSLFLSACTPAQIVFRIGDEPDKFYIILTGDLLGATKGSLVRVSGFFLLFVIFV